MIVRHTLYQCFMQDLSFGKKHCCEVIFAWNTNIFCYVCHLKKMFTLGSIMVLTSPNWVVQQLSDKIVSRWNARRTITEVFMLLDTDLLNVCGKDKHIYYKPSTPAPPPLQSKLGEILRNYQPLPQRCLSWFLVAGKQKLNQWTVNLHFNYSFVVEDSRFLLINYLFRNKLRFITMKSNLISQYYQWCTYG